MATKRMREEAGLQFDVVEEILARLPVKDVVRCKLLSKACYDLIKTPRFINNHVLVGHNNKMVFMSRDGDKIYHRIICTTLSSTEDDEETESQVLFAPPSCSPWPMPVGSCNGLLVMQSLPEDEEFSVFNPATKEYLLLPRPNFKHMRYSYQCDALGFGYDAKSGDYKLVKFGDYSGDGGRCSYLVEIWTMSTNTWKQITPTVPSILLESEYRLNEHAGLLVNGTVYWLALNKKINDRDAVILLSFELMNDTFKQIPLPPVDAPSGGGGGIFEVDCGLGLTDFMGCLAFSIPLPFGESCRRFFDIWLMGSDSVWTKTFSIGPFLSDVRITKICINGAFVLHRTLDSSCSEFFLYDPRRNKVLKEAPVGWIPSHITAWSYKESLVSVPSAPKPGR